MSTYIQVWDAIDKLRAGDFSAFPDILGVEPLTIESLPFLEKGVTPEEFNQWKAGYEKFKKQH